MVAVVAGAAAPVARRRRRRAPATIRSPQPEAPLAAETLPGRLVGAWPLPLARGAAGWLLPYATAARSTPASSATTARASTATSTRHARRRHRARRRLRAGRRLRRHRARALPRRRRQRRRPRRHRAARRHRRPRRRQRRQPRARRRHAGGDITAAGDDAARPARSSSSTARGALVIDLGAVAAAPTPWGDRGGFIVGGTLLVDGAGNVAPVPGRQVRDARVFRQVFAAGSAPTSDIISLDGDGVAYRRWSRRLGRPQR